MLYWNRVYPLAAGQKRSKLSENRMQNCL